MTLYHALVVTAKTAAPMIPFMAENIYQNLVRSIDKDAPESIHLCDFPTVDEARIDAALEADMEKLLNVVVLGRAARNGSGRKNRQPLACMYIESNEALGDEFIDIIKDELNVKAVSFKENLSEFIAYEFKPQLKTVGPKYGKQLGEIRTALAEIDGAAAKAELDDCGAIILNLPGGTVKLETEDLLISVAQKEGYFTAKDKGYTVVLDIQLTDELIRDGFIREIISKIQTMRKESGFEVMDHIEIYIAGNEKLIALLQEYIDEVAASTLADQLHINETAPEFSKEWDINGEKVTLGVKKI